MTLRGDLRSLARGDAEPLRWRLARRLLRWAGALLAKSHHDTLSAQTRTGLLAQYAELNQRNEPGVLLLVKPRPGEVTPFLDPQNAHGLLLQLAAASRKADRAAERAKP